MEQGLGNTENRNETPLISNIDVVNDTTGFILTRDQNNNIIATEAPGPIITNIDTVTETTNYVITRDENNDVIVTETPPPLITNIDDVNESTNYVITRDENNNVVVEEQAAQIINLSGITEPNRYHITRRGENALAILDRSIQIPSPNDIADLFFAIRKQGNNFSLFRTPAFMEYVFYTNNLIENANFDILDRRASRNVHVINASGKLVKFGILHTTLSRNSGLIDRDYRFEIIINDINLSAFTVSLNNSIGSTISRTRDIESSNIFVNEGDSIGLRYFVGDNSNRGNYFQARITVDVNARNTNLNPELIQ